MIELIKYTRSTLSKDYYDIYNLDDIVNIVDLGDGRLVSPDNELLAEKKLVTHYTLYKPEDVVDIDNINKYFIEIAWYDLKISRWFSAVLIPETWSDVLKAQEICEGREYLSEYKPFKYTVMKILYPLSNTRKSKLVKWNTTDAKLSLKNNSEHVYVTRGLSSGILTNHKFENMIHKNAFNSTSFTWVSAWTLES